MPYIAHISLVVRDYDEALDFYVSKLGFVLIEDRFVPEQNKRWVVIAPPPDPSSSSSPPSSASARAAATTTILLARASSPEQLAAVGRQTGHNRVFLFLATDDFARDHARFTAAGVEWVREPAEQDYGTVAVWRDLYGNMWDLIEYKKD